MTPAKQIISKGISSFFYLMPATAPGFIYTKILSIPPLDTVRDYLIKRLLPKEVVVGETHLFLNPKDAAVSGALAFGVYEPYEVAFFTETIKPGMNIVDIGANIGYYTVMAAMKTGQSGHVISYEPESENYSFLKRNVDANNLSNVRAVKMAIGDKVGTAKLYLTKNNKGTHSFANNRNDSENETVNVDSLDHLLSAIGVEKVDVLKIDIEGYEPFAFDGMKETLAKNSDIIIFSEIYPKAIRRTGRDPLDLLKLFNEYGFVISVIDENKKRMVRLDPSRFQDFIDSFPKGEAIKNLYLKR